MMKSADLLPYLGFGWSEIGNGPDIYNCWNYLRLLQDKIFGVEIPLVDVTDAELCSHMFRERMNSGRWESADEPSHGMGVLMRGGSHPHVGVYLETDSGSGIAHCVKTAGSVFVPLIVAKYQGFARLRYYRLM